MLVENFCLTEMDQESAARRADVAQVLRLCGIAAGSEALAPERFYMDYGEYRVVRGPDSEIAGMVHYDVFSERRCAKIEDIAVDEDARYRGIARTLMTTALEGMTSQADIVLASVWHDAAPFYQKMGFTVEREATERSVLMAKVLDK